MANRSMAYKTERANKQRVEAARQAAYSEQGDYVRFHPKQHARDEEASALIKAYGGEVQHIPCEGVMPHNAMGRIGKAGRRYRAKPLGRAPMKPLAKWADHTIAPWKMVTQHKTRYIT